MQTQPTIPEMGEERRERFRDNVRRNWLRVPTPRSLFELDSLLDEEEQTND